jgi:hypothetical protein
MPAGTEYLVKQSDCKVQIFDGKDLRNPATKSNSFAAREKNTRNTKRRRRSGYLVPVPVELWIKQGQADTRLTIDQARMS